MLQKQHTSSSSEFASRDNWPRDPNCKLQINNFLPVCTQSSITTVQAKLKIIRSDVQLWQSHNFFQKRTKFLSNLLCALTKFSDDSKPGEQKSASDLYTAHSPSDLNCHVFWGGKQERKEFRQLNSVLCFEITY